MVAHEIFIENDGAGGINNEEPEMLADRSELRTRYTALHVPCEEVSAVAPSVRKGFESANPATLIGRCSIRTQAAAHHEPDHRGPNHSVRPTEIPGGVQPN